VQEIFTTTEAAGHLKQISGRINGARLTPVGKARHLLLVQDRLSNKQYHAITSAYERFLTPNSAFKALITHWQMKEESQSTILAKHNQTHPQVEEVLQDAASADERFGCYINRLDEAKQRFDNGDQDARAKPLSESYHDIWMELHEDLLATLGKERTDAD